MQEGLCLEIERLPDRLSEPVRSLRDRTERVIGVMPRGLPQQVRREEAGLLGNRHKPIPITEVARQKSLEGTGSRHGLVPPGIPGEDFVASRACQHHLDKLAGQPGRVVIGIAHAHPQILDGPDHPRERPLEIPRVKDHLVMFSLEQGRQHLGVLPLVEPCLEPGHIGQVEASREGHEPGNAIGRQSRDRTRIHAPAQVGAHRHIADQLPLDRILEKEPKALPASLLGQILLRAKIKVPISPALDPSILDRDRMPRLEQVDALKKCLFTEGVLEREIVHEGRHIDLARGALHRQDRLHLRGEHQVPGEFAVVQRLDPIAVPGQQQGLAGVVPDRKREHPVQAFHACGAELLIQMQNDFGVRRGEEFIPLLHQFFLEFKVVVDFTVVGEPHRPGPVRHRLVAGQRQIEDGQPAVAQRETIRAFAAGRPGLTETSGFQVRHGA